MSDGGKVEKPQPSRPPAPKQTAAPQQAPGEARESGRGGYQAMMAQREQAIDEVTYRATNGAEGTAPAGGFAAERRQIIGGAIQRISRKKGGESSGAKVPKTTGSPLAEDVRNKLEPTLGADLSTARVHTGTESASAAAGFGARAFTVGNDVHFGAGEYNPGTKEGDKLIAHELTHVVQGNNSGVHRKEDPDADHAQDEQHGVADGAEAGEHEVSQPGEPAEQEADAVAEHAAEQLHGDAAGESAPQGGKGKPGGKASKGGPGGGKAAEGAKGAEPGGKGAEASTGAKGADAGGGKGAAGGKGTDAAGGKGGEAGGKGGEAGGGKGADAAAGKGGEAGAKGGDAGGGKGGEAGAKGGDAGGKGGDAGGKGGEAGGSADAPAIAAPAPKIAAKLSGKVFRAPRQPPPRLPPSSTTPRPQAGAQPGQSAAQPAAPVVPTQLTEPSAANVTHPTPAMAEAIVEASGDTTVGAPPANPAQTAQQMVSSGKGQQTGTSMTLAAVDAAGVTAAPNLQAAATAVKAATGVPIATAKKTDADTAQVDVALGSAVAPQVAKIDAKATWAERIQLAKTTYVGDNAWFTFDQLATLWGMKKTTISSVGSAKLTEAGATRGASVGAAGMVYFSFLPTVMHPANKTKLKAAAGTRFGQMKSNWEADAQGSKVANFSFEDVTISTAIEGAGTGYFDTIQAPEVHASPLNDQEITDIINGGASATKTKFQNLCATGAEVAPATGGGGAVGEIMAYARANNLGADVVGAIKYSPSAGPYGAIVMPGQREVDLEVRTPVSTVGILAFMRQMATTGSSGGLSLARFNKIWEKDPHTAGWVSDRFRTANRGQHEFIPCELINEVVSRANNPQKFFEGAKWVELQHQLRVPTNTLVFSSAVARTIQGKRVPQGHSGCVRGPDPANVTRIIDQTEAQDRWHTLLVGAFQISTTFQDLSTNIETVLNNTLWTGGIADADIHPDCSIRAGGKFKSADAAKMSQDVITSVKATIARVGA